MIFFPFILVCGNFFLIPEKSVFVGEIILVRKKLAETKEYEVQFL